MSTSFARCADITRDLAEYVRPPRRVPVSESASSYVKVYDGEAWNVHQKDDIMNRLVQDSASTMYAFVDEHKGGLSRRALDKFDAFDRKRDEDDPAMLQQLQRDAECTVINQQDSVGVRERVREFLRQRRHMNRIQREEEEDPPPVAGG